MKYLKKIFENTTTKEELQDLCDSYFAYLYDEGFKIEVFTLEDYELNPRLTFSRPFSRVDLSEGKYLILLGKEWSTDSYVPFLWEEIVDYYIPFLKTLQRRYNFEPFDIRTDWEKGKFRNPAQPDIIKGKEVVFYTTSTRLQDRIGYTLKTLTEDKRKLALNTTELKYVIIKIESK